MKTFRIEIDNKCLNRQYEWPRSWTKQKTPLVTLCMYHVIFERRSWWSPDRIARCTLDEKYLLEKNYPLYEKFIAKAGPLGTY